MPLAAPEPASPMKCPLPMLLANSDAPTYDHTSQSRDTLIEWRLTLCAVMAISPAARGRRHVRAAAESQRQRPFWRVKLFRLCSDPTGGFVLTLPIKC